MKRDFRVLPISSKERYFLLGSGKGVVHRTLINKQAEGFWEFCDNVELPKDTILDVEFVEEQRGEVATLFLKYLSDIHVVTMANIYSINVVFKTILLEQEGRSRKRVPAIHVNDVLMWCGNDLTGQPFESKRHLVSLLLKGMFKEGRHDLLKYHLKTACRLENIGEEFFQKIELGMAKGQNYIKSRLFPISGNEKRYVVPCGICLIKVINDPWMRAWSRSRQKEYFFHTLKRTSIFEVPDGLPIIPNV